MKFPHELKDLKIEQNPLQIAWRYICDPWWISLVALVFLISLFTEPMRDFDIIWQERPFGNIMELICRPTWTHFSIEHKSLGGRPMWAYQGLWLFFLMGTFTVDFAVNRLFHLLRRVFRRISVLHSIFSSRLENRHVNRLTRWLARFGIVLIGCLWIGVNPQFQKFLDASFKISCGAYATWWIIQIAHSLIADWKGRYVGGNAMETEQLFYIVRNSSNIAILAIMTMLIAANLGFDITSIVASLGLGTVAIGLGAQDMFANLFGALTIFMDRPFNIGDMVRIDANEGRVEKIGLRSTRIRNSDGFLITMPNKNANTASIINMEKR